MEFENVKIVVYVPEDHADSIRQTLFENGAGTIGNYDFCSFSLKGIGRFRGLENSKQFIGEKGKIEEVLEERIETICPKNKMLALIKAIKNVHPYEEPAIDVFPLLNIKGL